MNDKPGSQKSPGDLPDGVRLVIALVTAILIFIIIFQKNVYLGITVIVAIIFVAFFVLCLYILSANTPPPVQGGKRVFHFESVRPIALTGIFVVPLVAIVLLSSKPTQSFIVNALFGTPTPNPGLEPTTVADMELVDVSVLDDDTHLIEVNVRNVGKETAFLERAVFTIKDFRQVEFCPLPDPEPVPYDYNVRVPAAPSSLPYTTAVDISQTVSPNDVDHIHFRIGIPDNYLVWTIYQLNADIFYNTGDENTIHIDDLIVMARGQVLAIGSSSPQRENPSYSFYTDCIERDRQTILQMLDLPGIRTQSLTNLKVVAENDPEQFDHALQEVMGLTSTTIRDTVEESLRQSVKDYYDQGIILLQEDDKEQAIVKFELALTFSFLIGDTQGVEAYPYFGLGEAHFLLRDFESAITNLDSAIAIFNRDDEIKPELIQAYYFRGFSHRDTGNIEEAILDYIHAIELDPDVILRQDASSIRQSVLNDLHRYLDQYPDATNRQVVEDTIEILESADDN